MYIDIRAWCILAVCAGAASAREWAWPEAQSRESVRIDTKVRFLDNGHSDKSKRGDVQSDEVPFRPPTATDGFYNRPPGAGRYPVRVVTGRERAPYRVNGQPLYPMQDNKNDGTVDSIQYCKCVSTPDCNPRQDSAEVCGPGKYLCCFKRPNKTKLQNSEYFNEIDDERPMLFPGKEESGGGPFPPPPSVPLSARRGGEFYVLGSADSRRNSQILIGPGGGSGVVGPPQATVLSGPDGPTGHIGPAQAAVLSGPTGHIGPVQTQVLSGPNGPTGHIGPVNSNLEAGASAQRGILVGPGGPTGMIGPYNQRPVVVGSRGPIGVIGSNRGGNRGVLVGPGGPTGIIGPGYGRQTGPGLLVGPGGPTGTIGPGRGLLVGPGGPTGLIGPQRYIDIENQNITTSTATKKEQMAKNKNENKFSRSPRDACAVHARTGARRASRACAGDNHRTDASLPHTAHRRVRRGSCNSGCGAPAPDASAVPPLIQKGYRIKPTKPTRKNKQRKNSGCSRAGGGCNSITSAPARRMGIGLWPKRSKPHHKQPKHKPILRGSGQQNSGNKDKKEEAADDDFLGQLLSYMVSTYLHEISPEERNKTTDAPGERDKYGEIIITTSTTTTVKPSIFRKIPIFMALLKVIKAMIVFGIL